MDGKRT